MMEISFLGDISLNDNYIYYHKNKINPFSNLEPILSKSDFVVGNLECIAKGNQGENIFKKPRLTTTIDTLELLKNINLKIACLAQNHIYDHLEDGFVKTSNFLIDNNINFIGASLDPNKVNKPIIIEKDNIKVGLLNYVTNDTNPNLPENAKVFLNVFQIENAIKEIKELKKIVNHVVLILHWGGRVEGGLYPDWYQSKLAHQLIDEGADVIIGHHSHTVQPYEIYKGKHIFYSLGNFCFSDYWFENKFTPMPKRRKITFIPIIQFENNNYDVKFNYYLNKDKYFEVYNHYKLKHQYRNFIFKYLYKIYPFWLLYFIFQKKFLKSILFLKRNDITFNEKSKRIFTALKK